MNRLLLGLCAAAALWTAACGGGSIVPPPPPVGKYNLASLKGHYAFVTDGEVITSSSTATQLARIGSFIADGLGHITGGLEDVNAAGLYTPALQISGGSYTVNADGRGTLTLNVASTSGTSPINFGVVLTSVNDGLMIDETTISSQSSTGSGNFVLQRGAPFTVGSASGTYVFDFSGFDVSSFPDSIVGEFNVNGGVVSAGVQDENDNGALTPTSTPVSFTGTLAADLREPPADLSTFGRGVASLNGIQYVFYIVDSTRIRFLSASNGGGEVLGGDAVLQNNPPANLSGGFAFIVAGSSANSGVTRVGRFTANGTGLTNVTNVVFDTNNAGSFTKSGDTASTISNASVTMDAAHPGRGVLTFTDSNFAFPLTFVFYLSSATSGVVQEDSQSSGVAVDVADGSIAAQFGGPFSGTNITGTYALNWSGLSLQQGPAGIIDEEDLLAQTTVTSLALSGTSDIFQFTVGQPQTGLAVGGSITFNGGDGTGGDGNRTNMSVIYNKSSGSTVNCVVYIATPQLAFFANSNNQGTTRIIAGVLETQQ